MRLEQGASRWNYPVKGDALAIRYRRWRDVVEPRSKPWFKGYAGSSFKKGGGVKRGALEDQKDIEDLPDCCGACDRNLDLVEEVQREAPNLWPSSEKFKSGLSLVSVAQRLGGILFMGGYLLAVSVAILYLHNQYSQ